MAIILGVNISISAYPRVKIFLAMLHMITIKFHQQLLPLVKDNIFNAREKNGMQMDTKGVRR